MSNNTEFERIANKAVSLYAESIKNKTEGLHFVMIGMTANLLRRRRSNPTVDSLISNIRHNPTYENMPDVKAAAIRWIEENRE